MVQSRMQLALVFVIVALVPTVAAWLKWLSADRRLLLGSRKVFFLAGLCAVSLGLIVYCLFTIHTYRISGFGTDFSAMLRWARPGLWISLLGVLLSPTGKGQSRIWSLAASLIVLTLWIIPVWGM